jgi:hypothetical protein
MQELDQARFQCRGERILRIDSAGMRLRSCGAAVAAGACGRVGQW